MSAVAQHVTESKARTTTIASTCEWQLSDILPDHLNYQRCVCEA